MLACFSFYSILLGLLMQVPCADKSLEQLAKASPSCWSQDKKNPKPHLKKVKRQDLPKATNSEKIANRKIILKLCIDPNGKVTKAFVLIGSGDESFDAAIAKYYEAFEATPLIEGGATVPSYAIVMTQVEHRPH